MAAYVLTDWAVIQALVRAADRGVAIRVYLDGGQFGARDPKQPFLDLKMTPGVLIKTKQPGEPLMHFKARLSTNLPALQEGYVPVMFAPLDARSVTCG